MIRASYLFLSPSDDDARQALLRDTLLPLARALPGVLRVEAGVGLGATMGDLPVRAVMDLFFPDEDAMNAAFAAAEGRALARALTADPRHPPDIIVMAVVD